ALELGVSAALEQAMLAGSLADLLPGERGILLGRALAANLRLGIGDPINLVVPRANQAGTSVALELHRFTVRGIFDVQFSIGSDLALVHIEDSLPLLGISDAAERLHLRLRFDDIDRAAEGVARAQALLEREFPGPAYFGEDWSSSEASLFNALRLEKIMTWFMLMMIVAIGAFNIVSTLVMVVADKQADIAILRTMGAGQRTILGIFLVQGSVLGLAGILLGALGGVLIASRFSELLSWLERTLNPAGLYMLSSLPAELRWSDIWLTCGSALLISF